MRKRRKNSMKKILTLLLVFMMVFTMMPMTAMAGEDVQGTDETCFVTVHFDISSLGTDEALKTLEFSEIPAVQVSVQKGATLAEALAKAVEKTSGTLKITRLETGYITQINQVERYNSTEGSAFMEMMTNLGVETVPSEFQNAGWMYSGDGLTGWGVNTDKIEKDTTVDFRYTLYYGAASSTEWRSFDWDFVDAYDLLAEKMMAAEAIAEGGYAGFSDTQKAALDQALTQANTVKNDIDEEAGGMWAAYIAEKGTSIYGPTSVTAVLQKAASDLEDAIAKIPTPTGIDCSATRNGSENLDITSKATVYVGDTIQLKPVVLPQGANQAVTYEIFLGGDAVSMTETGEISCNAVSGMVMIQVKSVKDTSLMKNVMLAVVEPPKYNAVFTGKDGAELTEDSVSVKQGETSFEAIFADGKVTVSGLKDGTYDYTVTAGEVKETGRLIVNGSDVAVAISGKNVKEYSDVILENISSTYTAKSDDWSIMEMAAYAAYNPNTANKTTAETKQNYINNIVKAVAGGKMGDTDLDKAIIALTAIGGDATKLYPVNDNTPMNAVEKLNQVNHSTSAWSAPYTLAAYNQKEYDSESYENALVDALLSAQDENGSWNEWGTIDTTSNAIIGLSFYMDREDVATAIGKGLNYLSAMQQTDGAFDDGYGANSNSTAMVVMALAAAGVNPDTDARFVKNGNSALDGMLSFAVEENKGFGYNDNSSVNAYATDQCFRALIAAAQMLKTGTAYNVYDFSANEVAPVRATGSGNITRPEDPEGDNITVTLTMKSDTGYWINNYPVTIPGEGATVYHAFVKGCKAYGITYVGAEDGYVRSVTKDGKTLAEFDQGPDSGWMYKVNDELVQVGLTGCAIKDGDNIVWFYTEDWKTVPGAYVPGVSETPPENSEQNPDEGTGSEADNLEKLTAGVQATKLTARSEKTSKGIKITWTKSRGYKVDYYEVFRSTKRYSGYGKAAFYTTKNAENPAKTWYVNTKDLKSGTRYYYKVRGVRMLDGEKVYTQWSTKAWRIA